MGSTIFLTPDGLPAPTRQSLEEACLAGGYDRTPVPTRRDFAGNRLTCTRDTDESGFVMAAWNVPGQGLVMGSTGTLVERDLPYQLVVELVRGKLNQIRCQVEDWKSGGLVIPEDLGTMIRSTCRAFAQSLLELPSLEASRVGETALAEAYRTANALMATYTHQLFELRRQRTGPIESKLMGRISRVPEPQHRETFLSTFNAVCIVPDWAHIEARQSRYRWEEMDEAVAWALASGLEVHAGPIFDFGSVHVPDWVMASAGDPLTLGSFLMDFTGEVIRRYCDRVTRWEICTGSNCSEALGLPEDELVRLAYRMSETAWQIDSDLELTLGLSQPWGNYLTSDDHTYSPYVFADTLIRAGLRFTAINLEFLNGVSGGGVFCRDSLETSRLIDLFGILGVPLHITFGYAAGTEADPMAFGGMTPGKYGYWEGGFTPETQAHFASTMASMALCKPHVRAVVWDHIDDSAPHRIPNGGLIDGEGTVRPAMHVLRTLRQEQLR